MENTPLMNDLESQRETPTGTIGREREKKPNVSPHCLPNAREKRSVTNDRLESRRICFYCAHVINQLMRII